MEIGTFLQPDIFNKRLAAQIENIVNKDLIVSEEISELLKAINKTYNEFDEKLIASENGNTFESKTDIISHAGDKEKKYFEQFINIISHNLRSPLANIKGLCNIIKMGGLSESDQVKCLDGLSLSVGKLDAMIIDLNQFQKLIFKDEQLKEEVRLNEMIGDIQTTINHIIEKENVEIITNFEVEQFTTIKSYMYSILYNLIVNSIKYRHSEIQLRIEISTSRIGDKVRLVIKDNGSGMDLEKNREELFGLYKKFHRNTEGMGIGLYMVKTQVELMGGSINVESALNKGTEFNIELSI